MLVIVGCIVVTGCVLGGFMMAGGHIGALVHPSEFVTIGGASLGTMIVMAPKKVLVDLVKSVIQTLKGSPFKKNAFEELFKAMYELFRLARRDGMIALEPHLNEPGKSTIFTKYSSITGNHHALEFICGSLSPIMDGSVSPQQLPKMMEVELKAREEEHHAPMNVLAKVADALPGFGIVAAVLGIVITMGAIDGPVEEIGHKVGAALVGTFLGILLSYGFFAPLVVNMEFMGAAEMAYFRAISTVVQGWASDLPPKVAIELARRGLASDVRPSQEELEKMLKSLDAG